MSSTAALNYISLPQLQSCGYAMIAVTSAFALARIGVRMTRLKAFAAEDGFVLLAYSSFLTMASLYIYVAPTLYRISAVIGGSSPPYAEMESDALLIIRIFFANTLLLWCILWFVKASLLALYRRLLGSNKTYYWIWWAVVGFCILTFIGCVISHFTSCSSMSAWFTPGACSTPRDSRAQIISLYYAYAVDVLSDLMIMALPIKLIWHLQMPRTKKAGIIALFCIGIGAVAAATVRVVSIGVRAGNSTPSSTWLAFWGIIEAGIAVIIGTAPGLYTSARQIHTSWKESRYAGYHSGDGYQRQTDDSSVRPSVKVTSTPHVTVARVPASDDESPLFHASATSFSRPIYLKPVTKGSNEGYGDSMEMQPRSDTAGTHIHITRQFGVRDEFREHS